MSAESHPIENHPFAHILGLKTHPYSKALKGRAKAHKKYFKKKKKK